MPIEFSPQAVGAVLAATIAGGMSFLGSVFSKDQKTSEFRQAWIDGLRSEISQLICACCDGSGCTQGRMEPS